MKTVMVVDDEERILNIYMRMLVPTGLNVRIASNAEAATGILVREPIDLVLLDIQMPNIDGRTLYEVIQEYDPNIKIIVSSVYPIEKQKQLIPHAAGYYDKSEGSLALVDKVQKVLI